MPLDYNAAPYEDTSPTLLAAQPPSLAKDDTAPGKNWNVICQHLERRMSGLRMWRLTWWGYWATLAEYILPRRYHFLITANTMNRGVPINQTIVDSTATLAMQVCAAGMWSGLTPSTRPWFKLGIGLAHDEIDDEAKVWLEDTQDRLYYVLAQSNFYNVMAQAFQDVATFGTAPVIMYEDDEAVLRCYLPCAGEYYLAAGSRMSVDTLYREFTLTVQQIVDMFTLENCPEVVRNMWETGGGSLETEFVVAHAIEPNFDLSGGGRGDAVVKVVPAMFAWREVYWLKGRKTEAELSRRGFHESPFFVARWSTVSNDAYGRSPGMDCLGDTKQLQMETRRKGEFIEKLVRPPMGANPELKNEPSSILPGHITYTSTEGGKKGFWPLMEVQPAALQPMVADIQEIQKRIEKCYFVDVFLAITRMEGVQPRNELELTQRDLERLQILGPFVNLFVTECAEPAIKRALSILERRRLLKPMPKSLQSVPVKIELISMMKVAQGAAQNSTITQTIASAGLLAQAALQSGQPNPLDNYDLDEASRMMAENSHFPVVIMRSKDQVDEMRKQKASAAAAQQVAALAPAAVDSARTLSETNPSGGALGALLGAQPQGQA